MNRCENCNTEIEKGKICGNCKEIMLVKKKMKDFSNIFIDNEMEFEIKMFGDGTGYFFDFKDGIVLNFHNAGRIHFEYDKELNELGEDE